MSDPSAPERKRWLRFSLRTLFVVVTLLCIVLGLWIGKARRVDYAVEHFRQLGGTFSYQSSLRAREFSIGPTPFHSPVWVRGLFGDHLFDSPARLEQSNKHPLTDADLLPLAHLTELQSLNFNGAENEISTEGWAVLEGLVHLQRLILGHCKPTPTDATLSHVAGLKALEILNVRGNFTADGVAHLKGLAELRDLTLGTVHGLDVAMEHLKTLPKLEKMWIGYGGGEEDLTDVGMQHLAQFRSLKKVQLGTGKLTLAGYEQLLHMPKLEDLDLYWQDTADEVMPIVARIPKLSYLRIHSKRVTDAGLASLANATGLKALSLELEQADGSGLQSLVGLAQLEQLHFSRTPIVDGGLQIIAQFPSLKTLTLRRTKVTPAAVQKLRSQRSGLSINYYR